MAPSIPLFYNVSTSYNPINTWYYFSGYILDNNACVGIIFENRTWDDSLAGCEEADAHMFYVLDKSYQDALERNIQASYLIYYLYKRHLLLHRFFQF